MRTGCASSSTRRRHRSTSARPWRGACWPPATPSWPRPIGGRTTAAARAGTSLCGPARWSLGTIATIPAVRFASSAATPTAPTCGVKQHPDRAVAGWQVVALEPYGGGVAQLVAGSRPGDQRSAVGARSRRRRWRVAPAGAHRRTDPAGAATGHPPRRGPCGGQARPPASCQCGVGGWGTHPGLSSSTPPGGPMWTRPMCCPRI